MHAHKYIKNKYTHKYKYKVKTPNQVSFNVTEVKQKARVFKPEHSCDDHKDMLSARLYLHLHLLHSHSHTTQLIPERAKFNDKQKFSWSSKMYFYKF